MAFKKNISVVEKPIDVQIGLEKLRVASPTEDAALPITSLRVIFYRMIWCFAGPAFLTLLLVRIATTNDGWAASTDIAFLVGLVGTVAARWLGFLSGERTNTVGGITTKEQLHRYSMVWVVGGILAWTVANAIGSQISN